MNAEEYWKLQAKGWGDLVAKWDRRDRWVVIALCLASAVNSLSGALSIYFGYLSGYFSLFMSGYLIWMANDYRKKARKTNQAWLQCRNECLQKADQYA